MKFSGVYLIFLVGVALGYVPIDFSSVPFPITPAPGGVSFGGYMDGGAVDKNNVIYAANFGANSDRGTIGRLYPNGTSDLFFTLAGSVFTSIRIDYFGNLFVADVANKRVLKISPSKSYSVFCSDPTFLDGVPSDIALAFNGNLYLGGQNVASDSGEIWLCSPNGTATKLQGNLGRIRGLELTANDRTLYATEAKSANGVPVDNVVRAFDVDYYTGQLSNSRVFFNFTLKVPGGGGFDSDGIKVDIDGTLYVSRTAGGILALIASTGGPLYNIGLSYTNPTTVTFAGDAGNTVFIMGRCGTGAAAANSTTGCVDTYNGFKPGRDWALVRGTITNGAPTPQASKSNAPSVPNPTVPNAASSLVVSIFLAAAALILFTL